MKRYWKIISIFLVTSLVIGTFYIQSSFAANEQVKIVFEKINGDENEIENLILSGEYEGSHFSQSLQITNEETINGNNQSFFKKLKRLNVPENFTGLVDSYKNFMRGKDLTSNHFFEDENVLAYSSIQADKLYEHPMKGLAFSIEVMDKQTKEITSIELDVPERNNYNAMYVEHVQVIDDELKIIALGYRLDNATELHVYTIDLKEQKIVSDDIVASSPAVENGWSHLRVLNPIESFEGQKYFLIQTESFEDRMVQVDGDQNDFVYEHIVYDLENNQSKQVVIPDDIQSFLVGASAIYEAKIYIPSLSADGVDVNVYDIEKQEWDDKLTVALADMKEDEAPFIQMINGKLIVVYATDGGQYLFISDLKTGESLYKGKLHVTNEGKGHKDSVLYIHEAAFAQ